MRRQRVPWIGGDTSSSQSLQSSPLPTTTAMTVRGRRRWWSARGRRRQGAKRITPHGDRRPCLGGCGRRLRLRWPGRRWWQPRAVTWLPGLLSSRCRRYVALTAWTTPRSSTSSGLSLRRRRRRRRRKQELADEALDDKLEAEFSAPSASRQEARLRAIQQERLDLIERRKRRRAARKSKKRRKKKTPRTSSSCCRAHRRQRQWYVHGWFSWYCSSRCVPSFCSQAQDARHLGCFEPEGQLSVACAWLVLLVFLHLALCFFPSSGPRCAASWPVRTRRTVARAVQENWTFWEISWFFLRLLYVTVNCSEFGRGVHDYGFSWETTSECIPYSATFLRQFLESYGSDCRKTAESPQLQFIEGRRHSLRAAESDPHGPVGRKTIEVPQLQYVDR